MKKILFTAVVLALFAAVNQVSAQCDPSVPVIKWPLVQNPLSKPQIPYAPQGTSVSPFAIDGLTTDWTTHLLGTFTGIDATPYSPPGYSAANWSQDGISGLGDLDLPTPPRDLRFFAFTKDAKNVFFYFRRINNNSSQNDYYYFLDIMSNNNTSMTPDGFMNDGEPVLRLQYTNGSSGNMIMEVLSYEVNTTPGAHYVAGKGNPLTNPVVGPGFGLADGYEMVGDVNTVVLPALQAGEILAGKETEAGFGVEFAVPYSYLKNWVTNSAPITATNIFTYHISLTNGSGVSGTQDNAGGCCAGVAVSDNPSVTVFGSAATPIPGQTKARVFITYQNDRAASTALVLNQVKFKLSAFTPSGAGTVVAPMTVTVYPDAACANPASPVGGTVYGYNALASASTPDTAVFSNLGPISSVILPANGTACFIAIADFSTSPVKTAKMIFATTASYTNISTGFCTQQAAPTDDNVPIDLLTTLPVKFQDFTAVRNSASAVALRWITATEQNSAGFYVERNNGTGWQQMGYVSSQATNGNSNNQLTYTFADLNNTSKGISQYRIRQVDFDSKSLISDIRMVRGEGQKSQTIVFPNPSNDGKVTIVFENGGTAIRDVTVMDMSGRMVKQMKGVTNNNIQLENLNPGMYSIRIVDRGTGEQVVEKIVVNKR